MRIITGSTGTTHVTSNDDGEFNQGIFGKDLIVLENGNQFSASIVDNNTIRMADGDLILQGRHALIAPNTTEDIIIETGTVGVNRNDLIVARYVLDSATGYESITTEVLKGEETSGTAVDPEITTGDIRTGDMLVEAALYRVKFEGINIVSLEPLYTVTKDIIGLIADLQKANSDLNTNLGKVNNTLDSKASSSHTHSYTSLTDKPTIPVAVAVKGNAESSYRTGNVNITPANIGLGNVNNTADSVKNVSTAESCRTLGYKTDADVLTLANAYHNFTFVNNATSDAIMPNAGEWVYFVMGDNNQRHIHFAVEYSTGKMYLRRSFQSTWQSRWYPILVNDMYHNDGYTTIRGAYGGLEVQGFSGNYCVTPVDTGSNIKYLGINDAPWTYVISNNFVNSSDRNKKNNIEYLQNTDKITDFILSLKPCSYKFKDECEATDKPFTHFGFIAQDVEDIMNEYGIDRYDCGILHKEHKYIVENGEKIEQDGYDYSLHYTELIAPMLHVIQNQQMKIDELNLQLEMLNERISSIENN